MGSTLPNGYVAPDAPLYPAVKAVERRGGGGRVTLAYVRGRLPNAYDDFGRPALIYHLIILQLPNYLSRFTI